MNYWQFLAPVTAGSVAAAWVHSTLLPQLVKDEQSECSFPFCFFFLSTGRSPAAALAHCGPVRRVITASRTPRRSVISRDKSAAVPRWTLQSWVGGAAMGTGLAKLD